MRIHLKMRGSTYREIIRDLVRPHPFATERVGFVFGRTGSLANQGKVILINRYHSIPDSHYVEDPTVGARIGSEALTWAMQAVYHGRPSREGIFHIHMHGHKGEPGMSATDAFEIPKVLPGFQSTGRHASHGIIILSRDHGSAWVWLPASQGPARADAVIVVGAPVGMFERSAT